MAIRDIMTSAAKIGEHLAGAAAEHEAAAAAYQQAEADAVATAADPVKYAAAAERAAQAGVKYTAAKERVRRLQQAHEGAAECEQMDYIARLEIAEVDARVSLQRDVSALAARRVAEEKRHQEELAALEQQEAAARAAAERAKTNLRRARAGMTEQAEAQVAELRHKESHIRERYNAIDQIVADARNRFVEAGNRKNQLAEMDRIRGVGADVLKEVSKEHETAGRILADQNDQLRQRNGEIASIQTAVEELESVLRK